MRDGNEGVEAIESFARDRVFYEIAGIFGDGMAQIRGEREEQADI